MNRDALLAMLRSELDDTDALIASATARGQDLSEWAWRSAAARHALDYAEILFINAGPKAEIQDRAAAAAAETLIRIWTGNEE